MNVFISKLNGRNYRLTSVIHHAIHLGDERGFLANFNVSK